MTVTEVPLAATPAGSYAGPLGPARTARMRHEGARFAGWLGGRTVWHVNSTATGGGVAEMLARLLPLAAGLGVRVGWQVAGGPPEFFTVTKRLCEHLYGTPGDGGPVAAHERACYEQVIARQSARLLATLRPGDFAVLHDPQTAGLAPALAAAGCVTIWRCHVGTDHQNSYSDIAWRFLRPYLGSVHAAVFTLRAHAPPWLAGAVPVHAVAPSLDPLSPKNRDMTAGEVASVLGDAGLFAPTGALIALTQDRPVDPGRPLVVQISRWDRLKDMPGVLSAFAGHLPGGADLLLAGPDVRGVADDPAAAGVLAQCVTLWRALPRQARARVHLATLAMTDAGANARVVNALQRHAAVVAQKSLAEGFGLTVTEAMWKGAPIVASALGGIRTQLTHGEEGLLTGPTDLAAFGEALGRLLADRALAARLGAAARRRVHRQFLPDRHLREWASVLASAAARDQRVTGAGNGPGDAR
jgi:trehalose synthase